ncbi:hypothetical protein [Streptomyces sp. IBSBF 3010]|uniref:hypothetical protein n=1 Tax=Streptomyces sp. IBSBF 3010 TaxID=2903526 RepID=UPI002FDBF021
MPTTGSEHTGPLRELTIPLPAADMQALGADADQLAVQLGTVLHGLAQLRAGGLDKHGLAGVITDSCGLLELVQGIRDAAVRLHAGQGGSYGALAASMDVSRATAQYRRDTLLRNAPSEPEQWATGDS